MRKYSVLWVFVLIVGLFLFQTKAIVPGVITVASSEFFTGDPAKGGSATAIQNETTAMAHIHCNDHISHAFGSGRAADFSDPHYKAWDIGFGRYLVNGRFSLTGPTGSFEEKAYVCKLKYLGGDQTDIDNWELMGLDYA